MNAMLLLFLSASVFQYFSNGYKHETIYTNISWNFTATNLLMLFYNILNKVTIKLKTA